ncbi:adenine phosphoribosyltransferase [Thiotrichales bacterium 19S3-7]|nr:adenine phosphoribosyltransferase [Thiotrichales bacterium 19S3-7]MCF6802368.1 adenine phosphoribosyltransferase [Thiotrichales bacterium 19S3-11]
MEYNLSTCIRSIENFPKPNILFRDITTLLNDVGVYQQALDELEVIASEYEFDVIAAMESRGFIFGGVLADRLRKRFVPIRKPGKLPYKTYQVQYELEYGIDALEVHTDAFTLTDRVLIIDDLLATGGTAKAAADLVELSGATVSNFLFLIELTELRGREILKDYTINSLVKY